MTTGSPRWLTLLVLVTAGEAVFFLPFLLARVFRPTVLAVFGLTNLELGTAYAVYGVLAMGAYLAGGPLADHFRARSLLVVALATTAAGGLVLVALPGLTTLVLLYAAWGVTTIALFWAPLIKATRAWGGELAQGAAFGLLDGGRGLLAAVTGSLLVVVFAVLLPEDVGTATPADQARALRAIILILMGITVATAVLVWRVLPAGDGHAHATARPSLAGLARAARLPAVWLQALIILCAYVGFRALDDVALFADEVLGANAVQSAALGTAALWLRPVAAVAAGYLADRAGAARLTLACFALALAGSAILASGAVTPSRPVLFGAGFAALGLGVFALRGLYFAILQPARVPLAITGSAVGLVSLVGYTPDVFMAPLMGALLDAAPGAAGHYRVFAVVVAFAALGLVAALAFARVTGATAPRIGPAPSHEGPPHVE
jgi:MFS family permease